LIKGQSQQENFLPSSLQSQAGMSKSNIAPPGSQLVKYGIVLKRGTAGAWDDGMVESPMVWFDEARQRYCMVYTGYAHSSPKKRGYESVSTAQLGFAWSDDLLHWEKDSRNPVFGPSRIEGNSDSAGATGGFIHLEDGKYHLFYIGTTGEGYEKGLKTLNLATSSDLYHWTRYEGNPIIQPAETGWRKDAIWHPNIVKVNHTYYLFFNASGIVHGRREEYIGYATSEDLFHWRVDDEHSPLLVGSGNVGAWDATGRAGDPSIYKVDSTWYMAYYSWDGKHAQDGLAWTTEADFPRGWRMYEKNPILRIGLPGSYDSQHAAKPFIFRTPERHYHFYTAVNDKENREIALAVWPGLRK
jgi:predicted GH43/DUF377 family glycosyl hydrolase